MTAEEYEIARIIADDEFQEHEKATAIAAMFVDLRRSRGDDVVAAVCRWLKNKQGMADVADDLFARRGPILESEGVQW
jgi:hypothetical protein